MSETVDGIRRELADRGSLFRTQPTSDNSCPCGCGAPMVDGRPLADHPHVDPGDGRAECQTCGKWVHQVIHSCKGVPVTVAALARAALAANPAPDTTEGDR